jgi:hypothetical protein
LFSTAFNFNNFAAICRQLSGLQTAFYPRCLRPLPQRPQHNDIIVVKSRIDLHDAARLTIAMKWLIPFTLLLTAMLAAGCTSNKPSHANNSAAPAGVGSQTIVTPDNSLSGRVASYNATGRFVVLSFPVGRMPGADQTFSLYRAGLKVGEVKITGPQRDNNIAADLITGEAQTGDEVRDR